MKELLFAVMRVMLTAGSVSASDRADVMATVHQFIDGEPETAIAACADETSIIDECPPYSWRGPGACARWSKDYHDLHLKARFQNGKAHLLLTSME